MKGFDHVAPFYDFLARVVFGKDIVAAQECFLKEIKKDDRILILGGGTGWILESISRTTQPGDIWYVDTSPGMIQRARKRYSNRVRFITGTIDEMRETQAFNVVITNFFLDMFTEESLQTLLAKILRRTESNCTWLCADFVHTGKRSHTLLLKLMYRFFGLVASLDNKKLPDWEKNILSNGFYKGKEKVFYNGFIKSAVFLKR